MNEMLSEAEAFDVAREVLANREKNLIWHLRGADAYSDAKPVKEELKRVQLALAYFLNIG